MKRRGIALITVLCLSSLLLVLGITFLNFIEQDYRFAAQQDRRQQTYYLARAGLEFQRHRTDLLFPGAPPLRRQFPPNDPNTYFEVTVEANGRVLSRGVVQNSFRVPIAQHVLVVEPGTSLPEAHSLAP
jgi:hypothetical protein